MLNYGLNAVPFVVAVIVSLVGYRMSKPRGRVLIDSPWFWVFAFSTVGLLGVWAVSHKYDDREKRLEARYTARQRSAESSGQDNAAKEAGPTTVIQADPRGTIDTAATSQIGYPAKRIVPLQYLAAGLAVVSCVSAAILWRASRDDRSRTIQ